MTLLANPWCRWPALFAAWTVVALSFAAQFFISSSHAGIPISWRQALGGALGDWYVVALLSAPVVLLAHRFGFTREHWRTSLIVHLAGAAVFSAAFMVLRTLVAQWQGWAAARAVPFSDAFHPLLVKTWHFNLLIYGVLVAGTQAIGFYRQAQERQVRSLELEKRLAEARLTALQMQLNPHFLFNALNSIASLIHSDPEAADLMLVRLARLLRLTLDRTTEQVVSLEDELELTRSYLDIERVRFTDRLVYEVAADPETLRAAIPTLLLQPLVENAIKHGLSSRASGGKITITARQMRDRLFIEVLDNGKGLPSGGPQRQGIGLANTRARLQQLYRDEHVFALEPAPGGGAIARVSVPFAPLVTPPSP